MAARKAGKVVFDWVAISTKIPSVVRPEFNGLRNKYENARASMESYPEKAQEIDWSYYSNIITKPGLVESFKKQYQAMTVPYPKDTESAKIEAHRAEVEVDIQKEIAEAKKKAAELQDKLNELKAEKPYEEMNADEYLEDKPELKARIEDDIKNQRWTLTGPPK